MNLYIAYRKICTFYAVYAYLEFRVMQIWIKDLTVNANGIDFVFKLNSDVSNFFKTFNDKIKFSANKSNEYWNLACY